MAPPRAACPIATQLFQNYSSLKGQWEGQDRGRINGIPIVGTNKQGVRVQVAQSTCHIESWREIKEMAYVLLDKSPDEIDFSGIKVGGQFKHGVYASGPASGFHETAFVPKYIDVGGGLVEPYLFFCVSEHNTIKIVPRDELDHVLWYVLIECTPKQEKESARPDQASQATPLNGLTRPAGDLRARQRGPDSGSGQRGAGGHAPLHNRQRRHRVSQTAIAHSTPRVNTNSPLHCAPFIPAQKQAPPPPHPPPPHRPRRHRARRAFAERDDVRGAPS